MKIWLMIEIAVIETSVVRRIQLGASDALLFLHLPCN